LANGKIPSEEQLESEEGFKKNDRFLNRNEIFEEVKSSHNNSMRGSKSFGIKNTNYLPSIFD
jgi:hypothetical protein